MGLSEEAEEGLQGDDDDQAWRGGAPQVNGSRNGSTEPAHPVKAWAMQPRIEVK